MENEEKNITPSEYFEYLKNSKMEMTNEKIIESFNTFIKLGEKYVITGQKESLKKLCFLAETLKKEEQLVNLGITTYIYRDTIEDYIENVADKTVKVIELSRFMREIPDEIVETIKKTKDIFNEFYVVFTDYTGVEERRVQQERRSKDPILFGVFTNRKNVSDRFYFLGDWVDEYCDLTLDKLIEAYKEKKNEDPTNEIQTPQTVDELITVLGNYVPTEAASYLTVGTLEDEKYDDITMADNKVLPINRYKAKKSSKKTNNLFKKVRNIFSGTTSNGDKK